MKYLKLYENFENIERICQKYGIKDYIIDQDGFVNVSWHVDLSHNRFKKLPIKFGKVEKYFDCSYCDLITLEGSPRYVGGTFYCADNEELKTLVGGPRYVGAEYWAQYCNLSNVLGFCENLNVSRIFFDRNPVEEIIELVDSQYYAKFIFWLNEYDVIRDGNKIVEMRLEEAYWMTMKKELILTNGVVFKNYKLI